ncbi:MAG TPA: hypothetical protein VJI13_05370 [Candidatus Norongarragalinales archaeon]|nr:hypothetical protein [Candidatus Norongarragalinales archaeon]
MSDSIMKLKGASDWTPIYMLIVMVIAAILIYTLIKPILNRASDAASGNLEESRNLINTASFLLKRGL